MTRMGKKMKVLRCRLQTANVGRDTFKGEGYSKEYIYRIRYRYKYRSTGNRRSVGTRGEEPARRVNHPQQTQVENHSMTGLKTSFSLKLTFNIQFRYSI